MIFFFFTVHPVICPAQQHFHVFGSRFPDRAHGGTHLLPQQCFPELLHFGVKLRFRDPGQDHDKLVSADPVRLLREHLFQDLGHPADQPVARLVGVDQKGFLPDLEQVAAVCLKIIPHDFHQPLQGNVPVDPIRKLCHAPVEHRGDLQLFRDLRPAGLQLLQPGILLPDRHQKHAECRHQTKKTFAQQQRTVGSL